jgi:hypothetical protein
LANETLFARPELIQLAETLWQWMPISTIAEGQVVARPVHFRGKVISMFS